MFLALVLLILAGCASLRDRPLVEPTVGESTMPSASPTPIPATPTIKSQTAEGDRLPGKAIRSKVERITSPEVKEGELQALVEGNNAFAFDLYHAVRGPSGNLFYSPYSISLALAMTYAGARGETRAQMAETLHLNLLARRTHAAINALDLQLERGQAPAGQEEKEFRLHIVNEIWAQEGYSFLPEYLDLLARNYGAGLRGVDFEEEPQAARRTVNRWVSDQTEGRIEELLPEGAVDSLTRLVLTNAIYFKAAWKYPFEEDLTRERMFYLLDGKEISVPMMQATEHLRYAEGKGYQVVELPYVEEAVSMVVLLPQEGEFETFESALDPDRLEAILAELERQNVNLVMPTFEFDSRHQLSGILADLGMEDAFSPEKADFSGMDGGRSLYIQGVLHKAFVSVDEAGTEAAAATGVVVGTTSAPAEPVEITVNRPFVFLIRDIPTGSILFVGRVMDPSA
jgi:serpin B